MSCQKTLTTLALPFALWVGQMVAISSPSLAQAGIETLANPDYWNNLCRLQTQAGNPTDALPACEQAIALEPNNEAFWADYSYAHLTLEQYPESLAAIDQILRLNEQNSLAMTYQCMAYQGLNLTETALDACNRALEVDSYWGNQSPMLAWRTRGQLLHQMDQPEQALIAYNRALQFEADDSLTLASRCQTLVENSLYQYGIIACESALAGNNAWENESPGLAWGYQGRALSAIDNNEAAIRAYDQAISLEPENPEHWLQQGWLLEQQNQFESANISYSRAVELEPDSSRGLVGQCSTFNQQTLYEVAQTTCEQAIAGNGDWWPLGAAQAWRGLAQAMAGQGAYESALGAVERAVGMRPNYLAAHSDRSVILWYLGNYDEAIETALAVVNTPIDEQSGQDEQTQSMIATTWANLGRMYSSQEDNKSAILAYRQAVTINSQNAEIWANLSAVLWDSNQPVDALNAAKRATLIDPQTEQGWQNRGAAEATLGYYTAAEISYEQTLNINNQNADAWAALGVVQLRLGKLEPAMESLEIAIQLDPHQPLAREVLESMETPS